MVARAIADIAIGAEKLIFGSDFGATSGYYLYEGKVYPSYKKRPHPEQGGYHKRALDVIKFQCQKKSAGLSSVRILQEY